jgi:hypothetical protein
MERRGMRCTTGVYAWDPLLSLVVAGCAIGAIPASLKARSGRAVALAWLGGLALLALTIVLIRVIDSARESAWGRASIRRPAAGLPDRDPVRRRVGL